MICPTLDNYLYQSAPQPAPRPRRFLNEVAKFLALFIFFFVVLTLVVMAPTLYTEISYYIFGPVENKYDLPIQIEDNTSDIEALTDFWEEQEFIPAQDTIVIPRINVDAPIVYMESADNKQILEDIKEGVGHYLDTAMPGEVGNVFMTGHSSYYWWSGGKYNQVFVLLDRLEPGDLIYIYYQGGKYIYRVSGSMVVRPEQVSVLEQTDRPILTLMTCVPAGTNLRRLIVQADLIGRPAIDTTDFENFQELPELPVILPLY